MGVSEKSNAVHHDVTHTLLGLSQKARVCKDVSELNFLMVNASHQLVRYRQAMLWIDADKPEAVSGVITPEANAPMVRWMKTFYVSHLKGMTSGIIELDNLPLGVQKEWQEYLPSYGLWLSSTHDSSMGVLFVRDVAWRDSEIALLYEWWQIWLHAHRALRLGISESRQSMLQNIRANIKNPQLPWYKSTVFRILLILLAVMLIPVKMTVIAPGQIVPSDPVWVNSPIDGLIAEFYVQPGQFVNADEPLFRFDSEMIASQLEAAEQSYQTSMARYGQVTQQALNDERYMERLAELSGEVEQSRVELAYLQSQSKRSLVTAQKSGVVLFDHASEWIGKPISAGQQVMKIIDPEKKEIEAWLAIEDAIPIAKDANVKLHVNSAPFSPVDGNVSFIAYDATERPNGSYAYRLRASLSNPTSHRVGLKGTLRVSGDWTVLVYWLLRRPLGSLRAMVGF